MSDSSKKIFRYAGAIVAYLIGSGFASGQEVMQFFTAFGPVRGTIGGLIAAAILVYEASVVLRDSEVLRLEDANTIFRYYCGNILGRFFEWLMPLFLLGIYVIMLSGAGTLISEYYGLPSAAGRAVMLVLSLGTVLMGLEKLTNIVGRIGPVIIAMVVVVGAACILKNPSGIASAASDYDSLNMTKATSFWWLSGINYATFCAFTLMPFLAGMGKLVRNRRESLGSAFLGGGAFSVTAILLSLGISAYLPELYNKAVPTVAMADMLFKGLGVFYSLIMLAGIYTTAVPMLWAVCNKLVTDDRSRRFRAVAVIFACASYFGGMVPFAKLINIIYPYMGYFGIVVFGCIIIRQVRKGPAARAARK